MIGISANLNSVHVPMVPTGCLTAEFDSTYPIHLNGIISQTEYQQSMERINKSFSSYKRYVILCCIVFVVTLLLGTICFGLTGVTVTKSWTAFYIVLAFGIILTTAGSLFFSIGFCVIFSKRASRIREAIANESKIYSSRSPIPCSWRLDISRGWGGGYGHYRNNQAVYNLVIDIGNSTHQVNNGQMYFSNQVTPIGESSFAPPPYSGQYTEYCPQCNRIRQDSTAKFCSSCGHKFNKS